MFAETNYFTGRIEQKFCLHLSSITNVLSNLSSITFLTEIKWISVLYNYLKKNQFQIIDK